MANTFENKEIASIAGKASKRGKDKLTYEVKQLIGEIIKRNLEILQRDLDKMTKAEKWNILVKLAEYKFQKQSRVYSTVEQVEPTTIVFENVSKEYMDKKS
ncbi:MAG: hypothetical protein H8D45_10350 [Bacteroidetes bacterium]|nr:hypothetical protein [Bacteroidota bacterium]MBL7105177.1 hypothetical protein [Bacteroidales bacterium]